MYEKIMNETKGAVVVACLVTKILGLNPTSCRVFLLIVVRPLRQVLNKGDFLLFFIKMNVYLFLCSLGQSSFLCKEWAKKLEEKIKGEKISSLVPS